VVVGCDRDNNFYVLDIDRFKTNKISDYFDKILKMHVRWGFRKIRAEVNAAQEVIVEDLKLNYIRTHGLALSVESYRPTKHQGSKEERVTAILQPKFENRQIWFSEGGNTQLLEEELVFQKPAHDDIKDSLASCIEICIAPTGRMIQHTRQSVSTSGSFHPRFGGVV